MRGFGVVKGTPKEYEDAGFVSPTLRLAPFDEVITFKFLQALLHLAGSEADLGRKCLNPGPRTTVVAGVLDQSGKDKLLARRDL